ncbi:MAG: BON domain-containing protein [Gammaproteobacteria bacterium]|nr:BON domain-containing protein [Gammaproteobacteria bacterium]
MIRTRSPDRRISSTARCILSTILLAGILQGCAPVIIAGAAAGADVAHDRRTLGSIVNDTTVELKASGILDTDPQLRDKVHVSVTSVNGVVLLTGQAPTRRLRDLVLAKIRTIPSIRRLVDQIEVAPISTLAERAKDTWITTEVEAHFVATKGLDPTRIKVVTANASVYLMGLVTRQEADLAANAAANARGVARVVELFEYIN